MDVVLGKYIINKTNRVHKRVSRIVYSDYTSSFNKENYFLIHERIIQSLAIEIYEFRNGYLPNPDPYTLRNRQDFYSRNPKTFRWETETMSNMATNVWSKVTETIKLNSSWERRICL